MPVLSLGHFDAGAAPPNWTAYLANYHEASMRCDAFRLDASGGWQKPRAAVGASVAQVQEKLVRLGYLEAAQVDGIYGYRTQAAVHLFQEHERTVGGKPELGYADGKAGPRTCAAIDAALAASTPCQWTTGTRQAEADAWLALLEAVRDAYRGEFAQRYPTLFERPSDTLPTADWQLGDARIQLIGIRRGAWAASLDNQGKRMNNDVFVAIAGGQVMTFFGSTDPNPGMASRRDIPFLCKGQHRYRFGFHRLAGGGAKSYRALRPAAKGVRVLRDEDFDRMPSAIDRLDPRPVTDINIHWSGRGTSSWSAGCQVVAGAVYQNQRGDIVDCWGHAAIGYAQLAQHRNRGAYDTLMSWLSVCADDITTRSRVPYTLIDEDDLASLSPALHERAHRAFAGAIKAVARNDDSVRRLVASRAPNLLA